MKEELNAKKILLPYYITLLVLVTLMQTINITRNGNFNSLVSGLMLFAIFIFYMFYGIKQKSKLKKIRFGYLIFHFMTYTLVNISYTVAAFILYWNSIFTITGDGYISMPKEASGALYFMPIYWGIGLIIHTLASIFNRGFEEK